MSETKTNTRRARISEHIRELHRFCVDNYGLDLRALAIFRIGLGLLLLSDLYRR